MVPKGDPRTAGSGEKSRAAAQTGGVRHAYERLRHRDAGTASAHRGSRSGYRSGSRSERIGAAPVCVTHRDPVPVAAEVPPNARWRGGAVREDDHRAPAHGRTRCLPHTVAPDDTYARRRTAL
ncbi:hypothetical protein SCWH03_07070 [Streptomyces pacificus]|uniref:Uncharacterized protein n=1 Tax=Streptomyces pacificus TaxID=2705029 RepID=A0A6A0AQB5_9ACTN|nr:hypothetical protein SCWH03_07070 [Streptomyces pacificus]